MDMASLSPSEAWRGKRAATPTLRCTNTHAVSHVRPSNRRTLTEEGRPHTDDRGPLGHRRLEVGGHPHRQLGETQARPEGGQLGELRPRPGRLAAGGHAHQAADVEAELA